MGRKRYGLISLALVGSVLVWLPLLVPLVFGVLRWLQVRRFQVDFLMPFETYPVFLAGCAFLVWAALRSRFLLRPISAGLAISLLALVASQLVAVRSGLASGQIEPAGIWWIATLVGIGLSLVGMLLVAISGILLSRYAFQKRDPV